MMPLSRTRSRSVRRTGLGSVAVAVAGASSLLLSGPAGAAAAAGTPTITDRETVEIKLGPTGKVKEASLISQLVVTGDGKLTIVDPTSTKDLRNLDGFSKPETRDGAAVYDIEVDGRTVRRTKSDFTAKLPVTVEVFYKLDGERVDAEDIVGEDGVLEVSYTVRNVSATPDVVEFTDGRGRTQKRIVNLVTPFVGQLTTTLPEEFTDIESPRADIAGDGRGNNKLVWTMVLFEPIGENTQSFGYKTRITDGFVPATEVQIVPVPPARKPELNFGQEGFRNGAATASQLTQGAAKIDTNLGKLRDGAGELLSGLAQLADGARQLQAGLADEAAPGAVKLSEGLGQAKSGGDQLGTGANKLAAGLDAASAGGQKLAAGATELATGAGALDAGADKLAAGLTQISGGLDQLAATDGLPAARAGAVALRAGVDKLLAGLGSPTQTDTILGGLAALGAGLPVAKGGVDQIQAGLADATKAGGSIDQLIGAARAAAGLAGCGTSPTPPAGAPATVCDYLALVIGGLGQSKAGSTAAAAGLAQVSGGLAGAVAGVTKLSAGVTAVKLGISSGSAAQPGLAEGLDALIAGLTKAVAGIGQLAAGADTASTGAGQLADGTGKLAAGATKLSTEGTTPLASGLQQLAAGGQQLSAGATKLSGGLGQLYDGSQQLATGLDKAAEGSGTLAAGMDKAAGGGQQIYDGADLLQRVGTSLIVDAGNASAATYGLEYATMVALNKKAEDGALPYGAPEGATGSAAYDFKLAAVTGEGEGNAARGIVALLLLAGGAALATVLGRRRVTE